MTLHMGCKSHQHQEANPPCLSATASVDREAGGNKQCPAVAIAGLLLLALV
jgi:hypothetical protein